MSIKEVITMFFGHSSREIICNLFYLLVLFGFIYACFQDEIHDFFRNFSNRIWCVRKCGFYKDNYTIHTKKYMIEKGEYNKEWVVFEGYYKECKKWRKEHQHCYFPDRSGYG